MRFLHFCEPEVGGEEQALVAEVLKSNFLNDGEFTSRFEQELADRMGCRYAVAVTSGTSALFIALVASGVGAGDEVIVPDVTFVATANAVSLAGARAVLVDVDPSTLCVDPQCVREAITSRTRAIIPVHISGRAAAMETLLEIAREYDLAVIEDAAEALLSKHRGRCLGTWGDAGCFSFSPNKTITSGQGGLVVTNREDLHLRLRELKDQGRPARGSGGGDTHGSVGFNFKFTNLQAAVGLGQLTRLDGRLQRMREIYQGYSRELAGVDGLRLIGFDIKGGEVPQWTDALVDRRDELIQYLLERDIQCRAFWFPMHTHAPYRIAAPSELIGDAFPVSREVVPKAMWLPSAFGLTDEEVRHVCGHVKDFLGASG